MKKAIFLVIFALLGLFATQVMAEEAEKTLPIGISVENGLVRLSGFEDSPLIEFLNAPAEPMVAYPEAEEKEIHAWDAFANNMRLYIYFNHKYPNDKINENMLEDLQKIFPDYGDFELEEKQESIRTALRMYRAFDNWVANLVEKFTTPQEPPLIVDDSEFAQSYKGKYIPSDKLVVIMDFKKIIPYASDKRTFEAVEARFDREKESNVKNRKFQELKDVFSKLEFSKLPFYGVTYSDPIVGRKGIGDWQKFDNGVFRILLDSAAVGNFGEIEGIVSLLLPQGIWLNDQAQKRIKISFENSQNLAEYQVLQPMQENLVQEGKIITAYKNQINFPFKVYAKNPEKPLNLVMEAEGEFCNNDGCKKEKLSAHLDLQNGERLNSTMNNFVHQSFRVLPQAKNSALELRYIWMDAPTTAEARPVVRVGFESAENILNFSAFAEGDGLELGAPRISIDGKKATARFDVLNNTDIVGKELTVSAQTSPLTAIRQNGKIEKAPFFDVEGKKLTLLLLVMAFAGGLLLNVMPCVFPVLSLKLLSLSDFGAGNTPKVRRGFLLTLLGILFSFVGLIVFLLSLKALGHSIGWGMQFQNPTFLWVMIVMLVIFMAQIARWIQLKTPEWIDRLLDSKSKQNDLQNFLIGVFLVALATPCSAPYLGTAIGFALAGSAWDIVIIMSAVGLGLATPYLALYLNPQLSMLVPHPGKWMKLVLRLMNLMLLLTIIWLFSLLLAQTTSATVIRSAIYALTVLALLGFSKAVYDHIDLQDVPAEIKLKLRKFFGRIFAGVLLVILVIGLVDTKLGYSQKRKEILLQKQTELSLPIITQALTQNDVVLVAIGADWCLTCKFNDALVLNNFALKDALRRYQVKMIEIDWTNYDAEILKFMEEYGRKGLPFYVIYSRKVPNGMVLPEILNEQELIEIIKNIRNEN